MKNRGFRERGQWIGWISFPGSFVALIALILHLVLVAPGSETSVPHRVLQSATALHADLSLVVVIAGAIGCLSIFRRARRDLWLWLVLFVAGCMVGDPAVVAVLCLLPLACALELAREIPRAGHFVQVGGRTKLLAEGALAA